MNWIKNIILIVTAGFPLAFFGFSHYVENVNPGGYLMGIGFTYLLFLVIQVGLSMISSFVYDAVPIGLCSLLLMVAIGMFL